MNIKLPGLLITAVVLSACAAPPPPAQTAGTASTDCHMVYPMGSNIPVQDCKTYTDEEKRKMEQSANDAAAGAKPTGTKAGGS